MVDFSVLSVLSVWGFPWRFLSLTEITEITEKGRLIFLCFLCVLCETFAHRWHRWTQILLSPASHSALTPLTPKKLNYIYVRAREGTTHSAHEGAWCSLMGWMYVCRRLKRLCCVCAGDYVMTVGKATFTPPHWQDGNETAISGRTHRQQVQRTCARDACCLVSCHVCHLR